MARWPDTNDTKRIASQIRRKTQKGKSRERERERERERKGVERKKIDTQWMSLCMGHPLFPRVPFISVAWVRGSHRPPGPRDTSLKSDLQRKPNIHGSVTLVPVSQRSISSFSYSVPFYGRLRSHLRFPSQFDRTEIFRPATKILGKFVASETKWSAKISSSLRGRKKFRKWDESKPPV